MKRAARSVDAYISKAPKEVQGKLREVRSAIRKAAPGALEGISYSMPYYARKGSLSWNERSIVWFGLQSRHIGLYLPPPIVADHKKDLRATRPPNPQCTFLLTRKSRCSSK